MSNMLGYLYPLAGKTKLMVLIGSLNLGGILQPGRQGVVTGLKLLANLGLASLLLGLLHYDDGMVPGIQGVLLPLLGVGHGGT